MWPEKHEKLQKHQGPKEELEKMRRGLVVVVSLLEGENVVHWGAALVETSRCSCIWGFCETRELPVLKATMIQKASI